MTYSEKEGRSGRCTTEQEEALFSPVAILMNQNENQKFLFISQANGGNLCVTAAKGLFNTTIRDNNSKRLKGKKKKSQQKQNGSGGTTGMTLEDEDAEDGGGEEGKEGE